MTNMIKAIESAARVSGQHPGMVAVVCESKLTKRSRSSWFGFFFLPHDDAAAFVGAEYIREDGSFSRCVHVST